MLKIPQIELPIITHNNITNHFLTDIMSNKKVIIFGVPGAFTPTCSEKHLPSYINLYEKIISRGIEEVYCLSVNDAFVMKSWLSSYKKGNLIKGIADGNANFTKKMNLLSDYSKSFMGNRCKRFSLISENNKISVLNVENKGTYMISSAEYIVDKI